MLHLLVNMKLLIQFTAYNAHVILQFVIIDCLHLIISHLIKIGNSIVREIVRLELRIEYFNSA